ncbi:hypothetical protein [Actinomadura harenae]|uniref:hypothetical protein n=1 Tax=Actinomadura harenae TaxID=2483351 RepID=UPI0036228093
MLQGQRDLVLRPSRRKAWINLAIIAVVGPILATTAVFELGRTAAVVIGAVSAVLFVLAVVDTSRSRIVLTRQELLVRGLFRRQRHPRRSVARVVRASVIEGRRNTPAEILFVLDAQGGLLAKVYSGHYYSNEDVARLVSALDVPCDEIAKIVSAEEFAKTHPGLESWGTRHTTLLAFGIPAIVVVVFLALSLIAIARTT